ncbi:DUF3499 domain-containing protein [Tessaracoccus terricola]
MATLTYVYADQTAVLGPLAAARVPGAHDLCGDHAERTSVPRGWEVIRLPLDDAPSPTRTAEDDDDLLALADAVRAIGLRHDDVEPVAPAEVPATAEATRQAGHLRLLPSLD